MLLSVDVTSVCRKYRTFISTCNSRGLLDRSGRTHGQRPCWTVTVVNFLWQMAWGPVPSDCRAQWEGNLTFLFILSYFFSV